MNLEISIENDQWNKYDLSAIAETCASSVFSHLHLNNENVEICFLFTDDETIQDLNFRYRNKNVPTNVLSFPADSIKQRVDTRPIILGSVAISFETTSRESCEQNKPFEHHLYHLIVHSLLHLLEYDHIDDESAEIMETLEIEILRGLNIPDPYKQKE